MHLFGRANDAVHWACLDAQGATNAPAFVNQRQLAWPLLPVRVTQGPRWLARQGRESTNALCAAWWALIDLSRAIRDGNCIGMAVRISAAGALGLRQGGVKPSNQKLPLAVNRVVQAA